MRNLHRREVLQVLIAIDACKKAISHVATEFDTLDNGRTIYNKCPDETWLVYLIVYGTVVLDCSKRLNALNIYEPGKIWKEGERADLIRKTFPYEEVIENLNPKVIHLLDALKDADEMHG